MSYNIKLLLPPIFNRVMLNVDEHVFTLRSQKKRKLDNSLVFYWECRKKCGVIFLTTIVNGEHVKDKYFIQTDEHSHVPELLIENGYERLFKKCISNSCVEEHQSNSYQRNLYYYNAQHTGSTSTENAPSPLTDHLLHSQTYFNFQDFPAEFQNTLSGHKFYVKDIGREDSRIIIFSTIENLEYLSQSRYWLASGTHDSDLSSLKSFKHIYTIHGDIKIGNDIICVPLVFSLMAYPTINTYRTMFSELKSFAFEHDIYFEENTHLQIVTDLNIFAINALFNVFPFATHSIGFFHFSQNIYQQIHSERLAYKYNSNAVFNLLCRQISALAFLPASKVVEGWYKIKPFFSNNSDEQSLLSYFESTFISKRTCLRLGTEIPEQIPPLFHPQVWSVAAQVEVELSRTVVTELWYNRLKTIISRKPALYDLISQLQHIQNETENTLKQAIEDMNPNKFKKTKSAREERIKELVCRLINSSRCEIIEYIQGIANNINFKNL